MPREHTITETIQDTVPHSTLVKFLKENGLIPVAWDYLSLQVSQQNPSCEISFIATRSYEAKEQQ